MGIHTFRIQGALCHKVGSLLPVEGQRPRFAQIYVTDHDPDRQVHWRLINAHGLLDRTIVRTLQDVLHRVNPYYEMFKTACERMREDQGLRLRLISFDPHVHDPRRYNRPTASEIGVVVVGDGSERTYVRDIIIEERSGNLQRISELHSAYLPLRFPLLFPFGEPGWHNNIPLALNNIPGNAHQDNNENIEGEFLN